MGARRFLVYGLLWLGLCCCGAGCWFFRGTGSKDLTFEQAFQAAADGHPAAMERLRKLVCDGIDLLVVLSARDDDIGRRAKLLLKVVREKAH